jgi:carbonic anhydrase
MKIAWVSFELCAGMEMAAASIDEACSIKVERRRILDRIRSALNVLEKLLGEATDLLRRKDQKSEQNVGERADSKEVDQTAENVVVRRRAR